LPPRGRVAGMPNTAHLAPPTQMNKISTGNSMLDVLMCLFVPLIIKHIVPVLKDYLAKMFNNRNVDSNVYTREIQHVTK
jgi:hypothetical protein